MSSNINLIRDLVSSEVVEKQPLIVTPHTPVAEAMTQMSEQQVSFVLVMEQQNLVGIFTERDVVRMTAINMSLERVAIQEVMTEEPVTISVQDEQGIFSILYLLRKHRIRHLPVVDQSGQVLGVITPNLIREVLKPVDLLKFKLVANVMTLQVMQNAPTATVREITQQMATHHKSCVVITETRNSGEIIPIGIITERDIVKLRLRGLDLSSIQGQQVMSSPLLPIRVNDSLLLANELMKRQGIRRLVVVDEEGRLAGIITQSTILAAIDPLEMYATIEIVRQEAEERTTQLSQVNEQLQQEIEQLQEASQAHTTSLAEQLQEAREAARTANMAKKTFLRNISHELRTPLHAILGFSQLLERSSSLSQTAHEYVDNIRDAGEHLLKLVNSLLELSQNEAEGGGETDSNFNLDSLTSRESSPTEAVVLTREDLAGLPPEWLASLHQSTFEGDLEQILALIEQVRDRHEYLANALASLARNLQYIELLALTQARDT